MTNTFGVRHWLNEHRQRIAPKQIDPPAGKERIEVTRRLRFEAAHHLPDYIGDCAVHHGHSWSAEITVGGDLQHDGPQKGMVEDMNRLAGHFRTHLEMLLDHADLNKTIPAEFQPPTTENVARYLMASYLGFGFPVVRVTVRETENQTATVYA